MSDIVVVGAGVGGLAAAIRLAEAGHRVSIHERSGVVGGKLAAYERDGYRFDTGPSLLTLPDVFTGLGLDLRPEPLDPVVRHFFPDGTVLDSSSDHETFLARITDALGGAAARDWDRFWRRAERIWHASWESVLRRPVTAASLARLSWRLGDLAAIAPGRSLRSLGRRYLRDPRLRMLLDRYATYSGADPRRAPAALAAIPYAELAFGGWYLPGGLVTLAEALLARCEKLGVRVHLHSPVASIATTGARVSGVRLGDGTRLAADVVVSNVDAVTLYRDLLPSPKPLARLADRSLAGFVLLLAVRGETPRLAHHNVFFPRDYDAEFDAVFGGPGRRARPAGDPTVFVTRAADPAVRPAGDEAWFVLVNAAPHGTSWSTVDWLRAGLADAYRDRVLEVLAGRGLDVRDRLIFAETRTPADLAASAAAPGGAIYGTAGGLVRPANRAPVDGLFLVGGSTHPGGGLPMVTLSAEIVAGMIGSN
ncbi:phytoene desaturase [Actinoplanes sp. SE50]|uniref:phytoene desaturase family protein n=1 Tax=unclassified Actinoplanes TaxID=2626549 RepID=UPI00023ECAB4|nr:MULTISPECIES: phytoene desaturase family protein [unclassified Actinoplanes]AEV82624.1 zeta-phytoene desaturase [Actinoplanes sp. SE50/110]ATO81020.1 phytoene desaturase [Actinoplanes sp. SE50]SLL98427.1 phytoene desaturase [Actinoplanes sp. SE50/110]